jgi:ketosteroid isomerase-like protein
MPDGDLDVFRRAFDAVNRRDVALVSSDVRGRASGAIVPWRYWAVVSFRDGEALRIEWYADRAEAMRAAGRPD